MSTIIRSLCVMTCLLAGVYSCITYYYFRDAKRIIWFSAMCFALGVNINFDVAFLPFELLDSAHVSDIYDNVYLATLALSVLCLNVYTGYSMPSKYSKFHILFNYVCLILSAVSLLIPSYAVKPMFITLFFINICAYIFAVRMDYASYRDGHKYDIYILVANALMLVCAVFSAAFQLSGIKFYSPRFYFIPFYILLHGVMMTRHHRTSIKKTEKLYTSLQDTIERINHSDNALTCTQVKADFLYKSLDLISEKCDEDPFVAEDLTVSLSKYLRHTLNFQQLMGIVPLNNEIELTKAFIAIERERNKKITFEYKFPDPIPEFHIPPLSIQPLVENAIDHAFPPEQDNPKVTITIIPYRDYYHIDVSDNGRGMDEKQVESLTECINETARIGIYNIHSRLIGLFGKGLVIQSAPGVGTSVSFVVPPDAIAYLKEKEQKEEAEQA